MELVHIPRHLSGGTPCPREVKYNSRHRIKGFSGRHRLEVRPPSDETLSVSMQDIHLRHQTDTATQTVHQLETRSGGSPDRCSKCELAYPKRICLPSIQLGASSSKQVLTDQTEVVVVPLVWQAQPWWPLLLSLLTQEPVLLPNKSMF